jgi:hypothetical protein
VYTVRVYLVGDWRVQLLLQQEGTSPTSAGCNVGECAPRAAGRRCGTWRSRSPAPPTSPQPPPCSPSCPSSSHSRPEPTHPPAAAGKKWAPHLRPMGTATAWFRFPLVGGGSRTSASAPRLSGTARRTRPAFPPPAAAFAFGACRASATDRAEVPCPGFPAARPQ